MGIPAGGALRGAGLKATIQQLRRTDNVTNWWYIAGTHLYLVAVISAAVGFDLWRQSAGQSWLVSVPAFAAAIVLIGVGQHHLSGLAHEGSHHILFRDRTLNELASDLFCLFPLFSSTYHYRLQHLAHHQYVNDPGRDPDIAQLESSGHRLATPLARPAARRALLKQFRPRGLTRYILARASRASGGGAATPYAKAQSPTARRAQRVAAVGLLAQLGVVVACVVADSHLLLALIPPAFYVATAAILVALPESCYVTSRLRPVIGLRWMAVLRVGAITLLFNALAWAQSLTGVWAVAYFILLWVVPLLTSYAYFMLLRQTAQHANGDAGWLTNTRVFHVHELVRLAVFPVGQDYHLPHHLYATVPHYRLKKLHAALMEHPEYRDQVLEVRGTVAAPHSHADSPSIVDVLGPAYAPRGGVVQYIDDTVLDDCVVEATLLVEPSGARRHAD